MARVALLTIVKSAAIASAALELDRNDMADCLVNELDWDPDCSHLVSLSLRFPRVRRSVKVESGWRPKRKEVECFLPAF